MTVQFTAVEANDRSFIEQVLSSALSMATTPTGPEHIIELTLKGDFSGYVELTLKLKDTKLQMINKVLDFQCLHRCKTVKHELAL